MTAQAQDDERAGHRDTRHDRQHPWDAEQSKDARERASRDQRRCEGDQQAGDARHDDGERQEEWRSGHLRPPQPMQHVITETSRVKACAASLIASE